MLCPKILGEKQLCEKDTVYQSVIAKTSGIRPSKRNISFLQKLLRPPAVSTILPPLFSF